MIKRFWLKTEAQEQCKNLTTASAYTPEELLHMPMSYLRFAGLSTGNSSP